MARPAAFPIRRVFRRAWRQGPPPASVPCVSMTRRSVLKSRCSKPSWVATRLWAPSSGPRTGTPAGSPRWTLRRSPDRRGTAHRRGMAEEASSAWRGTSMWALRQHPERRLLHRVGRFVQPVPKTAKVSSLRGPAPLREFADHIRGAEVERVDGHRADRAVLLHAQHPAGPADIPGPALTPKSKTSRSTPLSRSLQHGVPVVGAVDFGPSGRARHRPSRRRSGSALAPPLERLVGDAECPARILRIAAEAALGAEHQFHALIEGQSWPFADGHDRAASAVPRCVVALMISVARSGRLDLPVGLSFWATWICRLASPCPVTLARPSQ